MNYLFFETYGRLLKSLTEASAPPPPAPGTDDPNNTQNMPNPPGTQNPAANGQNPPPNDLEDQALPNEFEISLAEFTRKLMGLDASNEQVRKLDLALLAKNFSEKSANPQYVGKVIGGLVNMFSPMLGFTTEQLKYNNPKFQELVRENGIFWAQSLINILKLIKDPEGTPNIEVENYDEITSENLDNFKETLKSLGAIR